MLSMPPHQIALFSKGLGTGIWVQQVLHKQQAHEVNCVAMLEWAMPKIGQVFVDANTSLGRWSVQGQWAMSLVQNEK